MELITNKNPNEMVVENNQIAKNKSSFIEANTNNVSLEHLQKDCIIPVFSKDNESTISHYQFIEKVYEVARNMYPNELVQQPDIRVSHVVKGRIPSAIGKPAKELKEHEKTIYYERCAFLIEIPTILNNINGNMLTMSIGGVRAYNQENLYSRKSLEKFKLFIGFQNKVCTNLCISTDGFSNEIRVGSVESLETSIDELLSNYDMNKHLGMMERMSMYSLNERQFAHFIGKLRMYQHVSKSDKQLVTPFLLNDSQINNAVKDYYTCPNFKREEDGRINLWNLYNLFTEANKSSYIDSNLERNVNVYEFMNIIGNSIQNKTPNWYLSN